MLVESLLKINVELIMEMSVHEAITKHSQRQHEAIKQFLKLDIQREAYIEEAINLCKQNQVFNTDNINIVTAEINQLAQHERVPTRQYVTIDMIQDYVKLSGK